MTGKMLAVKEFFGKRPKQTIILAALLCILLSVLLVVSDRPGVEDYAVQGLDVTQKDFVLTAKWEKDPDCKSYNVIISKGIHRKHEKTKKNSASIKGVRPGETYTFTVLAQKPGYSPKAVSKEVTVTKEEQKMLFKGEPLAGFRGDRFSVKTKAKGDVRYMSSDPQIAQVDGNGTVELISPGRAVIKIEAAGTELYTKAEGEAEVLVYPEKLEAPKKTKVTDLSPCDMTLKWKSPEYAQEYRIYKMFAATKEYQECLNGPVRDTSIKLTRDAGLYVIKAFATINGRTIESDYSDVIDVQSIAEEMPGYSEPKTFGTIGYNNVDRAVSIKPNKYTVQSLCITKDRYIVLFSSRSGKDGLIECYDFDGKKVEVAKTGNIGHGNGCTYNPATEEIYVMETWSKKKLYKVAVFNAKTLKRKDDITTEQCPTGIAYDEYTDSYCLTSKYNMYLANGDMTIIGTIDRLRYKVSQDVGAYNGLALSCIWTGGKTGYIDMYSMLTGKYVGSYETKLGEIESIAVKDGKFAILVNNGNKDAIYLTKNKIKFGKN